MFLRRRTWRVTGVDFSHFNLAMRCLALGGGRGGGGGGCWGCIERPSYIHLSPPTRPPPPPPPPFLLTAGGTSFPPAAVPSSFPLFPPTFVAFSIPAAPYLLLLPFSSAHLRPRPIHPSLARLTYRLSPPQPPRPGPSSLNPDRLCRSLSYRVDIFLFSPLILDSSFSVLPCSLLSPPVQPSPLTLGP